jgi:hypothetical protein
MAVKKFAMSLFSMWDSKMAGKMQVKVLVENFIALGLAANEATALHFFKGLVSSHQPGQIMRIEDILEHYVTVVQFAALFDSDQCTMRMLEQVNKEVHQLEGDKEAQTKNARIKSERIEMEKKKSRIKKGLNSKVLNTENYK